MSVENAAPSPSSHPDWCFTLACNADEPGGEHATKGRLIPTDGGTPLLVDLMQRPGEKACVRLTCGQRDVLLPLRSAKNLAAVVDVLAKTGRRSDR